MNAWYILFIVSYPILIILFLLFAHKKEWLKLDHKNLFTQKLFWIVLFIPFVTFLAFGAWAWWGKHPVLTAHGFERFLIISKLPLLFLASSVPLVSIVNNIHRTIQTEKQISEAEKKNQTDSYYNHFKHTLDLFGNIKSKQIREGFSTAKYELKIKNKITLYHLCFPDSKPDKGVSYNISSKVIRAYSHWDKINDAFSKLNLIAQDSEIDLHATLKCLDTIEHSYMHICHQLNIYYHRPEIHKVYKVDEKAYCSLFYYSNDLIDALNALNDVTCQIADILNNETINKSMHISRGFLTKHNAIKFKNIINSNIYTKDHYGWVNDLSMIECKTIN